MDHKLPSAVVLGSSSQFVQVQRWVSDNGCTLRGAVPPSGEDSASRWACAKAPSSPSQDDAAQARPGGASGPKKRSFALRLEDEILHHFHNVIAHWKTLCILPPPCPQP